VERHFPQFAFESSLVSTGFAMTHIEVLAVSIE